MSPFVIVVCVLRTAPEKCKHLLATRIAPFLCDIEHVTVSDQELSAVMIPFS
jgi:hypothetical protein